MDMTEDDKNRGTTSIYFCLTTEASVGPAQPNPERSNGRTRHTVLSNGGSGSCSGR